MNTKQKIIIWLAVSGFVLMTVYPPTFVQEAYHTPSGSTSYRQVTTYQFLFDKLTKTIDYDRLWLQWLILAIVTVGALCTFKVPKRNQSQN